MACIEYDEIEVLKNSIRVRAFIKHKGIKYYENKLRLIKFEKNKIK